MVDPKKARTNILGKRTEKKFSSRGGRLDGTWFSNEY
jgi:hypothetical protein